MTWLVACGALPVLVSPRGLGYDQTPLFEGEPWRVLGHNTLPGLALELGTLRLVLFPQAQTKGYREPWTLDALTAVVLGGTVEWVDVEVDGLGHDSRRDIDRSKDLNLTRVAFTEEDLVRRDFAELMEARILRSIRLRPAPNATLGLAG